MSNNQEAGLRVVAEMLPSEFVEAINESAAGTASGFGSHMGALALQNVFTTLWARPGLDRRSRSLVTLGILVALRALDEFAIHVQAGLRNGLTWSEIEEVLYHATAYAGFPAASSARAIAAKIYDKLKE
jgi:4-carboxymuconolactone decarboxylase